MRKIDLIESVHASGECGQSKAAAERAVNAVLGAILEGLAADGNVSLMGFGSLYVRRRPPVRCRNPRTGVLIDVPAANTVSFRPGSFTKEKVAFVDIAGIAAKKAQGQLAYGTGTS